MPENTIARAINRIKFLYDNFDEDFAQDFTIIYNRFLFFFCINMKIKNMNIIFLINVPKL